MPISHNRRSLDRVPRSPRSEVTPRRAGADPPPIVVVANFPMSPILSAIAAPGAPLSGHHHRAHRHRLITHSRAPAGAPPQTCLLPMSAPRNPLSARPRRCWPHRSARCPRLPSAAAPPGARLPRPPESARAQPYPGRRPSGRSHANSPHDHASPAKPHPQTRAPWPAPSRGLRKHPVYPLSQPRLYGIFAFPRREERRQILNIRPGPPQQLLLGRRRGLARRPPSFLGYRPICHAQHVKACKPATPQPNPTILPTAHSPALHPTAHQRTPPSLR